MFEIRERLWFLISIPATTDPEGAQTETSTMSYALTGPHPGWYVSRPLSEEFLLAPHADCRSDSLCFSSRTVKYSTIEKAHFRDECARG